MIGGEVRWNGRDLLGLAAGELRAIRGREIAMIFQDPTSSLNPVFTVGEQIAETLRLKLGLGGRAAAGARGRAARPRRHPGAASAGSTPTRTS